MKKNVYSIIILILIGLSGCIAIKTQNTVTPIIVTRIVSQQETLEVTRIIFIINTPVLTPVETLSDCYKTAVTSYEISQCAVVDRDQVKMRMEELVNNIADKFSDNPQKMEEFLQLQEEWETLVEKECRLWWASMSKSGGYEHGTSSPIMFVGCETNKYEKRIIELQILFDES
jgi:uncharacterized protein YecT (DUF1311 family)